MEIHFDRGMIERLENLKRLQEKRKNLQEEFKALAEKFSYYLETGELIGSQEKDPGELVKKIKDTRDAIREIEEEIKKLVAKKAQD